MPLRGDVPRLYAADERNAFVVRGLYGTAYSTHDGGATWRRLPLESVVAFATTKARAYAVTSHCSHEGACTSQRLQRAAVGTDAWATAARLFATSGPVATLSARGSRLWVLGTPQDARAGKDLLARSGDTGNSFVVGRGPCYAGLDGALQPVSGGVVWASCPTGLLGSVARSTDGGVTFSSVHAPPIPNAAILAPASPTVAVLAPNNATSRLFRTTDGGTTWQRLAAPGSARSVGALDFVDPLVGAAVTMRASGGTELWRTVDGGVRWRRLAV
jgi:photosystem II stability/assembly factor-like uncharacterized protein